MDAELEQLAARPWQFLAKLDAVPNHFKGPLGEVMEAYIRQAYHAGQVSALQELVGNSD